jgi:hypothetical protein
MVRQLSGACSAGDFDACVPFNEGRRQTCASLSTLMRLRARPRGFARTVMSTCWQSAVSNRISRSPEKFASRPLRRAETFG